MKPSKAQELATKLSAHLSPSGTRREAAALLREQDALLRQALDALNSGKHELRWAAADALQEHLK